MLRVVRKVMSNFLICLPAMYIILSNLLQPYPTGTRNRPSLCIFDVAMNYAATYDGCGSMLCGHMGASNNAVN